MALSTVVTLLILHFSHEDTSTAGLSRALTTSALDRTIRVDLVVLENSKFGLLVLVLDLLRGGVNFFLALLGSTLKTENQINGRLLLNVVVRNGKAILELLTGEEKTQLACGNSFHVYDLGPDIVDVIGRLHLEGDSCYSLGHNFGRQNTTTNNNILLPVMVSAKICILTDRQLVGNCAMTMLRKTRISSLF